MNFTKLFTLFNLNSVLAVELGCNYIHTNVSILCGAFLDTHFRLIQFLVVPEVQ